MFITTFTASAGHEPIRMLEPMTISLGVYLLTKGSRTLPLCMRRPLAAGKRCVRFHLEVLRESALQELSEPTLDVANNLLLHAPSWSAWALCVAMLMMFILFW